MGEAAGRGVTGREVQLRNRPLISSGRLASKVDRIWQVSRRRVSVGLVPNVRSRLSRHGGNHWLEAFIGSNQVHLPGNRSKPLILCQSATFDEARMVPSGRIRPRWYGTITCLPVTGLRHFWWLPELPAILNPPRRRIAMTSSAVRRGVPRSPNHHLDEFGIVRQVNVGRGKIESNGILDIVTCFCFGITRRSAPRQFGAHSRPTLGDGIMFEDHTEFHISVYVGARLRFRAGSLQGRLN